MKKYYALMTATAVFAGSLAFWGCQDNNLFGSFHDKGSGDPVALLSDGKAALANREFNNAKTYYEAVIEKEPTNSEALYGAATATMGTAGLDMGTLMANVVNAKTATSPSLGTLIQQAAFGVHNSAITPDKFSLLSGIDLDNLGGSIDQIVCFLLKIRSGNADGKISPEDIGVLMSVGISCIIRGILRPLEVNVIDLRQSADGTDYEIVIISSKALKDICDSGVLQNSASDLAGGLQAIETAANVVGSKEGSTLKELALDLKGAFKSFQKKINDQAAINNADSDASNNVPASCLAFINGFNPDALTPPSTDPGDCLKKGNKPVH